MAKNIRRRPFHPYEENILRTLYKSNRSLTPTRIADIIGIHPVTAKKRINELKRRKFIICDDRGKRRYCKINKKRFRL